MVFSRLRCLPESMEPVDQLVTLSRARTHLIRQPEVHILIAHRVEVRFFSFLGTTSSSCAHSSWQCKSSRCASIQQLTKEESPRSPSHPSSRKSHATNRLLIFTSPAPLSMSTHLIVIGALLVISQHSFTSTSFQTPRLTMYAISSRLASQHLLQIQSLVLDVVPRPTSVDRYLARAVIDLTRILLNIFD